MNCDDALLNAISKGSVTSFKELYVKHYRLLFFSALYILKDEMDAEDQVQQLFVDIWEARSRLTINVSIKAYLQRAVRNRCLKVIEKRRTEQLRLREYLVLNEPFTADESAGEKFADLNIDNSLSQLPFQRRQAFSLVYLENKKYKEAAAQMGVSVNSIKTHLRLALKTLKNKFVHDV